MINQILATSLALSLNAKATIQNFVNDRALNETYISETFTDSFIDTLLKESEKYSYSPWFFISLMQTESRYNPEAENYNGSCLGLCQLNTYYHTDRMIALRGDKASFYNAEDNLVTAIDYFHEIDEYYNKHYLEYQPDTETHLSVCLMEYNGGRQYAIEKLKSGIVSTYAKNILKNFYDFEDTYGDLYETDNQYYQIYKTEEGDIKIYMPKKRTPSYEALPKTKKEQSEAPVYKREPTLKEQALTYFKARGYAATIQNSVLLFGGLDENQEKEVINTMKEKFGLDGKEIPFSYGFTSLKNLHMAPLPSSSEPLISQDVGELEDI